MQKMDGVKMSSLLSGVGQSEHLSNPVQMIYLPKDISPCPKRYIPPVRKIYPHCPKDISPVQMICILSKRHNFEWKEKNILASVIIVITIC